MVTSTNWYRTGTVSLTSGSNAVVGTNTYWLTAGLNPGDIFKIDGVDYEVYEITDSTHITLAENYAGTTGSGKAYAIIRNFTATMPSGIAAGVTDLMKVYEQVRDGVYLTIQGESAYQLARNNGFVGTEAQWLASLNGEDGEDGTNGKSAYQIACEKGYVGTESEWVASLKGDNAYQVAVSNGYNGTEEEWLESLKAAGEWTTLDERTDILTWWDCAGVHNSIWRGQDLGTTFTSAQWTNISTRRFRDLWMGDYWTLPSGKKAIIAGFNYFDIMWRTSPGSLVMLISTPGPLNSTEEPDATYANSHWFTVTRAEVLAELMTFFGSDKLKSFNIHVPVSYSGAAPSSYASVNSMLHMQPYSMITGFSAYHAKKPIDGQGKPTPDYWAPLPIYRNGFTRGIGDRTIGFTHIADTMATKVHNIRYLNGRGYTEDKTNTGSIWGVFFVGGSRITYEV